MRRAGTLENMLYSVSKCLIKIGIFEKLIVSLFSNWKGEHDADEFMKKLKLRASSNIPESRCTIISECMDQVKPGLKNVYADVSIQGFRFTIQI